MGTLFKGFVLKVELNPSTEEILYQKIGAFGCVKTEKVKTSDLEYVEKEQAGDHIFKLSSKPVIDQKLVFRVKSTG